MRVDAVQEIGGRVFVRHERTQSAVTIVVRDEGPGLSNTANLFVVRFSQPSAGAPASAWYW